MGSSPSEAWPPAELLEDDPVELYEQAPCGYLSTNGHGTIVKINRTLLEWLGYNRDDLVGSLRFQDLLTAPGRIFYETHYVPLLQMQGRVNEIAFDMLKKDGEKLPVLVNATAKKDESNALALVRATIFNATDRRAYERELLHERRQADRAAAAKSRYLSMLSHDIRNPLTAIIMSARTLRPNVLTATDHEYIDIIEASANQVLTRIRSILNYRRLESGNVTLESKRFDLRRLLETCSRSVLPQAEEKRLTLSVNIDPALPDVVMGDPAKIAQVIDNLLGNAVKFTDSGSICLSAEMLEHHGDTLTARISVADTGVGIPSDRLEMIFEEFYQADSAIGPSNGSAGLGLAICREIVGRLGGTIMVSSTEGEGTQFWFDLPLSLP